MLTLQNFDTHLDAPILKRGREYYQQKAVISLEESAKDEWTAEVEGSEIYSVEVTLKKNNEVKEFFCDCPCENTCKHAVAVFFALRDTIKNTPGKRSTSSAKNVFENLLSSVNAKEYQDFIRSYAKENKNFKREFELYFAEKDSRIDVEKHYSDLIAKLIRSYSDRGYIDYRGSYGFSSEVNMLLKTGYTNIAKHNYKDAFALGKVVIKAMMNVITACDDSNGNISGSFENAIDLIDAIVNSATAAIDIKEQIFHFLLTELNQDDYFDYGDFGYNMLGLFEKLAITINKPDIFLGFIDKQIPQLNGKHDDYKRDYFQKIKIRFLKETGKVEEASKLVLQNLDIPEVRQGEVNEAIKKKDFAAAKKLIAGGIKVANDKDHPGTVHQWEKELLRIAVLEKDIATIRHYTKYFAFDRWFNADYYNQWKQTFTVVEWKDIIEDHIKQTIEIITKKWSQNKNKFWHTVHPPLLESLAPIYIQEKYWDRLLTLVQQDNTLNTTLNYHTYLVKIYPDELIQLYAPCFEDFGLQANSRNQYADLVSKMKMVIKDIPAGKEKIVGVAQALKSKFSVKPRRPAMIEELDKILV